MVLSTMVGYNGREARQMGMVGKHGDAKRLHHQGTAVMQRVPWTPEPITLALRPLYTTGRTEATKLQLNATLKRVGAEEKEIIIAAKQEVEGSALPFTCTLRMPDILPGNCMLEVQLTLRDGAFDQRAAAAFTRRIAVHVEPRNADIARLRHRIESARTRQSPDLPSGEYALVHMLDHSMGRTALERRHECGLSVRLPAVAIRRPWHDDKTVAATQSRAMVAAAKKPGACIEYVEVPRGSHSNVVVPQFGKMLDFFAAQAGNGRELTQ